jgi:lipid-A-disaccharide synthase
MVRHILPFLAADADRLAAERAGLRFVMAQAPYIDDAFLRDFPAPSDDRVWDASAVRYQEADGRRWMLSEAGTRIEIVDGHAVLGLADVAVSLPGTNTGEMAASGIPMAVILPTQMAEHHVREVPLPGLAGHVGRLPVVGHWIKRLAARAALRATPILALPNRRAGRKIVPELTGTVTPAAVAETLGGLLDGDLAARAAEVQAAMGQAGAADRLARAIADHFAGS